MSMKKWVNYFEPGWETRRTRRRDTETRGGDIKRCCCRRRHWLVILFWNGICYQMQIS